MSTTYVATDVNEMTSRAGSPSPAIPLRRNREFQLLWIGQAASSLGTQVSQIAFPLLVLSATGSAAQAGLVGFALTLPLLVFSLPAGELLDRWNRRRVMLTAEVVRALALLSVAVAVLFNGVAFYHLLVVAFVVGTFTVAFDLADTAALRFLVPEPQVPNAVAQIQARENAAWLAGGPLGGFLFGVSRALPFLVDAISYGIGLVTTVLIRSEFQGPREAAQRGMTAGVVHGLRWVWRQPYLRGVALLVAAGNGVTQAMMLIIIFVADDSGASPAAIGLMLAIAGLGGFAGALATPLVRRWLGPNTIVVGLNWLWVVVLPFITMIRNPLLLGGLAAVLAFGYPAWNATTIARRLAITPEDLLGRAQSIHRLLGASTVPLGALLGGALYEAYGVIVCVGVFAAVMFLVAVGATFSRSLRVP